MKKRVFLIFLAMIMTMMVALPGVVSAAKYDPVYVTDQNGTTCTGDFDKLTSGQIIFYPQSLMEENHKYPVLVWANGTMCAPALYYEFLSKVASEGYVVVTNTNMMSADGKAQIGSVDYILAQAADVNSIFYNKIDIENIGVFGHSQGGRSSVNAAVADRRVDCVMSIAGSSFTSEVDGLTVPTLFTTGSLDSIVSPGIWVLPAFNSAEGVAVYASLKRGLHTSVCTNPSVYSYYAVRWFDCHLKGDATAKNVFTPGGELANDSKWTKFRSKGI